MDDDTTADAGRASGPDAVQAGIEQFQRAALDAVRAARAALDAAEAMIQDPAAARSVIETVTALVNTASEAFGGWMAPPTRASEQRTAEAHDPDDDDGGFERIAVN